MSSAMIPKLRGAFVALCCILTVPTAAGEPHYEEFGAFLEEFRKTSRTPALSALIVKDGEIVWEAYLGYYDDEGDHPTLPETTYKIASVTKPIAATAIIAEINVSGLTPTTPMSSDSGWNELCDFFVNQTSIPFMAGGEDRHGNAIAPMACDKPTTLADMLDMRANGDAFVYNPIAFARIDRAVSGAGGRDLRDIVRERVVGPAGMEDTALGWRDPEGGSALRYLAEPFHVVDGVPTKQPLPDDDFRAAAGIIASPRAIAAFDIAFDEGRLVTFGAQESFWSQKFLANFVEREIGPLGDYRLGWWLEDWEGKRLMWHSGWNERQYSALYLKVPEERLTLIVLANTEAVYWGNSLVKAEVIESPIARRFLETFAR